MLWFNKNRSLIFAAAGSLAVVVFSAHNLPAGYTSSGNMTSVEIDGVNYGSFDQIAGLDFVEGDGSRVVTLKRDFVTDPSLYQWARASSAQRHSLKDITLVTRRNGDVVSTHILKLCQPVSWSVEAANPALGGFHEKVDLAVQGIEEL